MVISGDPTAVPRRLPAFDGNQPIPGIQTGGGEQIGDAALPDRSPDGPDSLDAGTTALGILLLFVQQLSKGLAELVNVTELYSTFIRWGPPIEPWRDSAATSTDLSVLQSMPLLGAIVTVPVAGYHRLKRFRSERELSFTPRTTVDLFVVTYLLVLLLIYLPRLPINTSVTVRYLHPLYPLGVYIVARLGIVRQVLSKATGLMVWSYLGTVVLGGPMFIAVLVMVPIAPTDHVQFHGLITLSLGLVLAGWSVWSRTRGGSERSGAILLGLAAGSTTLFLLLVRYLYFTSSSNFAIPVLGLVADALESLL
jgi:hypothetical protein